MPLSPPPATAQQVEEQKHLDLVRDEREHKRETRLAAPLAAGDNKAAARLKANAAKDSTLGNPQDPVAFMRIDVAGDECFYVGYHSLSDRMNDRLVYNWQSNFILGLRAATHDAPGEVVRHRNFAMGDGNQITTMQDVVFAELAARIAALEGDDVTFIETDAMLQETLGRARGTEMQQIVETIQAAQSTLISADAHSLLVIQGGPGTGKTAVALHRVSAILYNYSETAMHAAGDVIRPEQVLVIGPNATFTRYISRVLPELGDAAVAQTDLHKLLEAHVKATAKDGAATARLKGDERMVEVISKGLVQRVRRPKDHTSFSIRGVSWRVSLDPSEVEAVFTPLLFERYAVGRTRFRTALLSDLGTRIRRQLRADRSPLAGDPQGLLDPTEIDNFVERVWPSLSPQAFLRDLFGNTDRLLAAASGTLTADEVQLLRRTPAPKLSEQQWTREDLVLLDQAGAEISGDPDSYRHIVVDEAQDLSPMQWLAVRRRSERGAMTIVGDIAQSTGHWARDSWDEVIELLSTPLPTRTEQLTYGYRVPRSVMDLAALLLPIAAPGILPPVVVRDVERPPVLTSVPPAEDLATSAVRIVEALSGKGNFVGVICPDALREDLEIAFMLAEVNWNDADKGGLSTAINLVSPVASKGLEFDAVVVVDPAGIVAAGPQGERMLYIALTRTTKYLDIVYPQGTLPAVLGPQDASTGSPAPTTRPEGEQREVPAQSGVGGPPVHEHPATMSPLPSGTLLPEAQNATSNDRTPAQRRTITFQAATIRDDLMASAPEPLWGDILREALRVIEEERPE
ncbi:helicase IV [Oerskovia enterophila]|uniref:Helicase IV n=1 Tax=Oerskovia enterophila TaxID=43678 RepID=A0ABX2Y2I6_9CELL|nr:helicase IV [Oerskovia enterophila]